MQAVDRPSVRPQSVLFAVLGIAYPFLVYFGIGHLSPLAFALGIIGLLSLRLVLGKQGKARWLDLIALGLSIAVMVCLLWVDALLAVKAYPVTLSLSLASVFGYSLFRPPTVIERFARLMEPSLNEHGVRYTRTVTKVWVAFFLINAGVSLSTALMGDMALWTLYNGLVSYLLMGLLFGGEFLIRQRVKKHHKGEG
jgi:uncharacterized membrane protein